MLQGGNTVDDSDGRTTWEEMTLANETEGFIKATPKEIRKIKTTIEKRNIKSVEIQAWKNSNWAKYETILESVGGKEYEVMRIIVQSIIDERRINMEMINEQNVIAELIGFREVNEKAENMKLLADDNNLKDLAMQEDKEESNDTESNKKIDENDGDSGEIDEDMYE